MFNYLFITVLGWQIGGITLSTSLVTLYNAVGLGLLMHKKVKLDYKDLFVNLAKMVCIGAISFVLSILTAKFVGNYFSQLQVNVLEILRIVLVSIVLFASYVGLSFVFKVGYVDEVKERILAKIRR